MHMHVFVFRFLNVWMKKIMLHTNQNYLFKATVSTIFSSKNEKKTRRRFAILNWKLLSTLEILLIQIKYKSNSVINYQKEEDSFPWLKTTLATLSNQRTTVQLRYFLQRRTENDSTNTQKHLQFFCTKEAE